MSKISITVSDELAAQMTAFYGKPIGELTLADIALAAYLSGLGPSHIKAHSGDGVPIEVSWPGYPIRVVRVEPGDTLFGSYPKNARAEDVHLLAEALRKLSKSDDVVMIPDSCQILVAKWSNPDLSELKATLGALDESLRALDKGVQATVSISVHESTPAP